MPKAIIEVENKINGERLNALLTVQESLASTVVDAASLTDVLSGIFKTSLETMGTQNGRLLLINRKSNQAVTASAIDGRVTIETSDSISDFLIRTVENFVSRHGQELSVSDTQSEEGLLATSFPETTTTPWSEISVPVRIENLTVGLLSLLKPGLNQFGQEDTVLLSLFAGQLSAALTAIKFKEEKQTAQTRVQELLIDNHDMAAILVHDLKGPLSNLLTSLEMVQAEIGIEDESTLSVMMDIAVKSSKQLEALVNSLLDISRLEAGQPITDIEAVAVSDLVDYVVEVEGPVLEQRQVILVRDLDPNLPLINANIDILQRVLLNLLDNALKVSKRDQKITVSASTDIENGLVRICVVDQGPGIPEKYHERIFEKYQRVEDSSTSKGLGLGLAFCKLAMEAHGGQIWVENVPDRGACFCMILPVERQAT